MLGLPLVKAMPDGLLRMADLARKLPVYIDLKPWI
jgi:hypothetical protein